MSDKALRMSDKQIRIDQVALSLLIASAVLICGFALVAIAPNRQGALQGHNQLIFYTALAISVIGLLFGGIMYAEAKDGGDVSAVLANLATAVFFISLAWHLVLWLPDLRAVDWSPPLLVYSVVAGCVAALFGIFSSLLCLL